MIEVITTPAVIAVIAAGILGYLLMFWLKPDRKLTEKKVRRLRKRVGELKKFRVKESHGLFGDFASRSQGKLVKAGNKRRAVQIYFKWYWNFFKRKNNADRGELQITVQQWGRLEVTGEDGFKTYYT